MCTESRGRWDRGDNHSTEWIQEGEKKGLHSRPSNVQREFRPLSEEGVFTCTQRGGASQHQFRWYRRGISFCPISLIGQKLFLLPAQRGQRARKPKASDSGGFESRPGRHGRKDGDLNEKRKILAVWRPICAGDHDVRVK